MKILRLLLFAIVGLASASTPSAQTIPLPEVPASLRLPQERADYIITHFWDTVGADSLGFRAYPRISVEQSFADFISVFPYASEQSRQAAFDRLVDISAKNDNDLYLIADIAERYLYDIESPVASEEYFILFLHSYIADDSVAEMAKLRQRMLLDGALKNRPGDNCSDFPYLTPSGAKTSLYKTLATVSAPSSRLLLIFYDPDCSHCREVMDQLTADTRITAAVTDGSLTVLAIYSGEEHKLWLDTLSNLPKEWLAGYDDGTLQEEGTYVIRTLPSLYLIAPSGIVLAKEITPDSIFH